MNCSERTKTEELRQEDDIQEVQITGDEEDEDSDTDGVEPDWQSGSALLDSSGSVEVQAVVMRSMDRREEEGEEEEQGEADPDPLSGSLPAELEYQLEDELQRPERNQLSENTRLATRYAVRIFREYLSEKAQSPDFETLDKDALCAVLRSFYAEARSKSGQLYSKSSLISIRSSLNRYLNEPPYCRTLDLTKDPELRSANLALAAVIRRLEEQGAGPVVQKQAITRSDLRKLYQSTVFNTSTPYGLLNKVWFEICMYFCTRGRENQRELQEDSFGLAADGYGRQFVYFKALGPYHKSRCALWTKKRPDAEEDTLPRMYETGTELCPYASFVRYVSKRNRSCRAFFQRPRDHCCASDVTWYENKAIGKNLLGTRMQMLSRSAKLSKTYTNHCIGAVSIATLNCIVGVADDLEKVKGQKVSHLSSEPVPPYLEREDVKPPSPGSTEENLGAPQAKRMCVRAGRTAEAPGEQDKELTEAARGARTQKASPGSCPSQVTRQQGPAHPTQQHFAPPSSFLM